jgi:hypothetical protein
VTAPYIEPYNEAFALPEPSFLALCELGVVAAAGYARRRRKARG